MFLQIFNWGSFRIGQNKKEHRMKTTKTLISLALSSLVVTQITACHSLYSPKSSDSNQSYQTSQNVNQQANDMFEQIFNEMVMASPINQTYLGIKTDYDKWDNIGDKADDKNLAIATRQLAELASIDKTELNQQTRLSYDLLEQQLKQQIADDEWRHYNYLVNQMFGVHSSTPSLLINQHLINDMADAKAYISRLNGIPKRFNQLEQALSVSAQKGIIPPKFVFPYVISDSENIITGAPFDNGSDSPLWQDFNNKIDKLEISNKEKQHLKQQAKLALIEQVKPAYIQLISYIKQLETKANTKDGVWKFPKGEKYYNSMLMQTTTTSLSAEEIHQIGLNEVERIHAEMKKIMQQVNFNGNLQQFFIFMRDDPQFYYANTDEGKQAYLNKAKQYINEMASQLDTVFSIKPKAELIVKPVEAFREKSAGKAFYTIPSPDGSRPGTYYANLYDMSAMPTYQAEALAYHEGIPGHHMQLAIAQELENIPQFRRYGSYTAYIEGWGLYSEYFPKEMGMYADPYSDFGRLAMELWRACRLVVDTGIHAKKWTREQSIEYYQANTPNAEVDAIKMVERHIVMPSQATAYKIGMMKILKLRNKAKAQLGEKFKLKNFHSFILKNGPLPLDILELQVNNWINQEQASN